MKTLFDGISEAVERNRGEALSFLQKLISAASPSGEEAKASRVIAQGMRAFGFDEVEVDNLNDTMGVIKGSGGGRDILFNGHLDHVPPGEMEDPYKGKVMDGRAFGVEGQVVYGRAASDMKGALAAMVMAGKTIKDLGIELKGDFKIAAVALEEMGGAGTLATIEESNFTGDLVVIGEATEMEMALGHRGGARANIVVEGRSCHASAPERGVNALYKATEIISRIRSELIPRLPDHPLYSKTSIAITRISVKPDAPNVVPEECTFHIDCRNNPDYPRQRLVKDLEALIIHMQEEDPELKTTVVPSKRPGSDRSFTGFYTDPEENPVVDEAKKAVAEVLGRDPRLRVWKFATDGRFYAWRGIPVIGFGPGEERFAHTNQDHVRIDDYIQAIKVYTWLACKICGI
ncbi:MAG: ArgE/DapE family deacylase [Candidatus Bathyarchaeota archaeon]